MEVTESDHKPVRCKLNLDIAHVDRSVRRQEVGNIVKSSDKIRTLLQELCYVPDTVVSTNSITLQNQHSSILKITSRSGGDNAIFQITCEGQSTILEDEQPSSYQPRGCFGFPRWLEVMLFAFLLLENSSKFLKLILMIPFHRLATKKSLKSITLGYTLAVGFLLGYWMVMRFTPEPGFLRVLCFKFKALQKICLLDSSLCSRYTMVMYPSL